MYNNNMCAHIQRILHKTPHQTMLMAFVFTLVNLNSGLTSHVEKQSLSDDTRTYMNRNLIIASAATATATENANANAAGAELQTTLLSTQSQARLSSSSVSASISSSGIPASMSTSSILGYQPHGAIAASSSSTYRSYNTAVSPATIVARSSNAQVHFPHTSGSSITSFDSTNVIDDRQLQQQQQQQHIISNNKNRATHTLVNVAGVAGAGAVAGTGFLDNQLESTDSGSGDSNLFISPMYFGTDNASVITTQIGATAHIPCTVHHIGDGVVSWIRKKDYHLLTVGLTTYSSDERFSATHLKHSEDWTLQIKFVQLRDAGVYECQVSTHPPTSIFLHLNVVEARAEISGPPIRYLTPGSTLRLQCRVVQNTEASEYIFWYHDNRMINYDIDRGINVSTEPDFQSSELTIQRTRREHSGNYTCVASNTQPASVLVHIFKGDNPAAMYHGHVGSSTKSYQTHLHCIMVLLILGYRLLHSNLHMSNTLC